MAERKTSRTAWIAKENPEEPRNGKIETIKDWHSCGSKYMDRHNCLSHRPKSWRFHQDTHQLDPISSTCRHTHQPTHPHTRTKESCHPNFTTISPSSNCRCSKRIGSNGWVNDRVGIREGEGLVKR